MTLTLATKLSEAASTESPAVVQVVWHQRVDVRRQAGRPAPARARRFASSSQAKRFIAENYANLQQLAVTNTRELTGKDRF
jgi:hypothetical protein